MEKNSKIYVAGHRGLVGSALVRALDAAGYNNLLLKTSQELDLRDQRAVDAFFEQEKPAHVFLAAAKVGGILANDTYRADFIAQNLQIQTNVITSAHRHQVDRLMFLGSACIYPRLCPQPMAESVLLTAPLEPTNQPYAIAKIAGIETCWSFNRQYGTKYIAAMPTNLYGPGDNYDLQQSHVLPALMRKMHMAKVNGDDSVTLWGTGKPKREFLYSDDLAQACVFLMQLEEARFTKICQSKTDTPLMNIGYGTDQTIAELATMMREIVGYEGHIHWDTSKPDGIPQKLLDSTKMHQLGWRPKTTLRDGLQKTYLSFQETYQDNLSAEEQA